MVRNIILSVNQCGEVDLKFEKYVCVCEGEKAEWQQYVCDRFLKVLIIGIVVFMFRK